MPLALGGAVPLNALMSKLPTRTKVRRQTQPPSPWVPDPEVSSSCALSRCHHLCRVTSRPLAAQAQGAYFLGSVRYLTPQVLNQELPSELLAASFTSSLGELSLRCNALAASTLTSLCALRSLQSLDLAANQLSALPLDALPRTLTHLDVSANALTALSLTALVASLPRLTTVSLAYNRLTSLDSLPPPTNIASSKTLGFASALPLLTHIDVSSNRLTSLAAVLSSSCVFNYVQEVAMGCEPLSLAQSLSLPLGRCC